MGIKNEEKNKRIYYKKFKMDYIIYLSNWIFNENVYKNWIIENNTYKKMDIEEIHKKNEEI